ncbi:MAG: hypothetical protein Q7J32_13425 [Sphingomonadaceae bacterium]|nr:hypothetical protein [Sphingomonadaceae bacterium]
MCPRKLFVAAIIGSILGSGALANEIATPGSDADKIICKKSLETGSLVRKTKRCFTQREWDRLAEMELKGNKRMVDEMQGGSNGQ